MKQDGRKLSHETSEAIRRMAVKSVRSGEKPSTVMRHFGLCRTTIYRWLRTAHESGLKALAARKHPGPTPKLTEKQKKQIARFICGKDPRQYGFDFGLWTRQIVAALIKKKFKVTLGVTAVGRLLAEMDITPQKPLKRAYERDPKAIREWVKTIFPNLKKKAKRKGGKIFFLDEAGVRSDANPGKTWGKKGETPVVHTSGKRQSVNAISAVNSRGAFWYDVYSGKFNATKFMELLKKFMRGRSYPVLLVLDGHPAHKAKLVKKYVSGLRGRLELHFLPGYAPELNPDEFVWNHLKTNGVSKRPLLQNESLRERVESDLKNIKRSAMLVRSFFRAPSVAYTTD